MNDTLQELKGKYTSLLQDYLEGAGEAALLQAQMLGQRLLLKGWEYYK